MGTRSLAPKLCFIRTCLWKYTLAAYTKVDTDDTPFDTSWVITSAISRAQSRIEAYAYKLKAIIKSYRDTGRPTPPKLTENYSRNILPAARFDENGNLQVTASLLQLAKDAGYYTPVTNPPSLLKMAYY